MLYNLQSHVHSQDLYLIFKTRCAGAEQGIILVVVHAVSQAALTEAFDLHLTYVYNNMSIISAQPQQACPSLAYFSRLANCPATLQPCLDPALPEANRAAEILKVYHQPLLRVQA